MSVPRQSSFAPAFWLLPEPERAALAALHRFCRAADDAVDAAESPAEAEARLSLWRREVAALYGEGAPATEEGRRLAPHVATYGLRRADFDRLLAALGLDVAGPAIATASDLERYCEGVAASPGYLALGIFGCPEARPYAHCLGLALQLTNVLRDLREDLRHGRAYLPEEDLVAAGLDRAALAREAADARPASPEARRLVTLERARARRWFDEAERAYRELPAAVRRRLATARAMERLYRDLLARLEREEPLPRARVRPGRLGALAAVAGAWLEGLAILG